MRQLDLSSRCLNEIDVYCKVRPYWRCSKVMVDNSLFRLAKDLATRI